MRSGEQGQGRRFLRGDEGNEENPLSGFWIADSCIALERAPWELRLSARNLLGERAASFGTYNVNQTTGGVERFLTPIAPRSLEVTIRRALR